MRLIICFAAGFFIGIIFVIVVALAWSGGEGDEM